MKGGLQGCLKYSGSCLLPSPWGKLAASLSVPLLLPLHPSFCFQTASACRGYRLLQGTEFRKELIQPHHFSSCFATFLNLLYWGGGGASLTSWFKGNCCESCRLCHSWLLILWKNDFFSRFLPLISSESMCQQGQERVFWLPTLLSQLRRAPASHLLKGLREAALQPWVSVLARGRYVWERGGGGHCCTSAAPCIVWETWGHRTTTRLSQAPTHSQCHHSRDSRPLCITPFQHPKHKEPPCWAKFHET